jgi:raffinose/stachyose/melibiose transport system permease protein
VRVEDTATVRKRGPLSTVMGLHRGRRPKHRDAYPPGEASWLAYLFILPALVVYCMFTLFPLGHAVWMSFYSWDGITTPSWVGLGNYATIIHDPNIRATFWHPAVLLVFYSVIPICIGLVLAGIFRRMQVRGMSIFRTLLFLPQVVAPLAVAIAWSRIYDIDGPLNTVLRHVGLVRITRAWLGDFTLALPSVAVIGTWFSVGFALILFLAGVQKIPTALYDAARVDGAGAVREFVAVTLPGLRREIVVALVLTLISALRNFDIIYFTTRGGPGYATSVPSYEIYRQAFLFSAVGKAAAYGVALTIIIMAVVVLVTRLDRELV